jgi:hypothetical protein
MAKAIPELLASPLDVPDHFATAQRRSTRQEAVRQRIASSLSAAAVLPLPGPGAAMI